mmetsp:Transcript_42171/g.127944  ORF Transcript_42171/g.127944 Transcript_42171/m.127944 type:complete len:135 (-) Transcript_42171:184-588(-)
MSLLPSSSEKARKSRELSDGDLSEKSAVIRWLERADAGKNVLSNGCLYDGTNEDPTRKDAEKRITDIAPFPMRNLNGLSWFAFIVLALLLLAGTNSLRRLLSIKCGGCTITSFVGSGEKAKLAKNRLGINFFEN